MRCGGRWSTDVPCYNPRDIVDNIRRLMNHEVLIEKRFKLENFDAVKLSSRTPQYCL